MISTLSLSNKSLLILITVIIAICVIFFNVFYFSAYYGMVQVSYTNSLLLVPFVVLVFSFGLILGDKSKLKSDLSVATVQLTARENEILQLILSGKKNKEIATELFVELSTIKSHINNIYKKTAVKNRKSLIQKFSI